MTALSPLLPPVSHLDADPGAALETQARPWWSRLRGGGSASSGGGERDRQLGDRLAQAAQVWTHHLGTAQAQMRDATDQLLQGFVQILDQLDAIVDPGRGQGQPVLSHAALDQRAALLAQSEAQLRGLLDRFQGFVRSRDEVLGSVRSLSDASNSLRDMAEDVAKLARQTNLLSINAAIEAARAGPSGRGFAVVAAEVRRLSAESGDTGRRIGEQVDGFADRMKSALQKAADSTARDTEAIHDSEHTVNAVVQQVDTTVSQLNERAAELSARGEAVKAQVEQLMVAFQFQDRVQQIIDQVNQSILSAMGRMQQALAQGQLPSAAEWDALLSAGYTTDEQRAVIRGAPAAAASPQASQETTFF